MTLVAGIDSSTQSTKVELRDIHSGVVIATARGAHPTTAPPVSEQHPDAWWEVVAESFAQLTEHLPDVVAISVGGQQHGLVVLDASDAVIRPAKLWNDTTSAPQAARLREAIGTAAWVEACGLSPVASFTITKLAWLAESEPAHYARIARMMLPHDWITWRLCGEAVTDRGDASGTGWFDPVAGRYRSDLLALAADGAERLVDALPRVLGPTELAGTILPAVASELGLRSDVVIGPGSGDNMAAALGLGFETGDAAISLGTSGTAYAVSDRPARDESGLVAGFADATGRYLPLVATLNATRVTDTVADWLGVDQAGLAALALQADVTDAPVLVPFFDGERSPNLPNASGHLEGLRTTSTREQLAWAAHAGVLCGLLAGVDALSAAGASLGGSIRLIGGGAKSPAYRQVLADLLGVAILVPTVDEAVAAGAAVQAAAVHEGADLEHVARRWNLGTADVVEPTGRVDAAAARARYATAAAAIAEAQAT